MVQRLRQPSFQAGTWWALAHTVRWQASVQASTAAGKASTRQLPGHHMAHGMESRCTVACCWAAARCCCSKGAAGHACHGMSHSESAMCQVAV